VAAPAIIEPAAGPSPSGMLAGPSAWNMALLSPQEQEGIIGSAAKAAELQQRGQLIPSEIYGRNAQAIHALTQAGLAPSHLGLEAQRVGIAGRQASVAEQEVSLRGRTVAIAEEAAGLEKLGKWSDAQRKWEQYDALKNFRLSGDFNTDLPMLLKIDPDAAKSYVAAQIKEGTGGKESMQVRLIKFIAANKFSHLPEGEAETAAIEFVKGMDEQKFVQTMLPIVLQGETRPERMKTTVDALKETYAYMHSGTRPKPGPVLSPDEASKKYGY
jgi:hypothetical protein